MDQQLDMFGGGEGRKQRGMSRAVESVSPAYRRLFVEWVANQSPGALYTSESVTAEIGLPRGEGQGMNRNNSVGALMHSCAKMGLHQKINLVVAKRPNQNATMIGLWQRSEKHSEL